jgi:hypothetical protein
MTSRRNLVSGRFIVIHKGCTWCGYHGNGSKAEQKEQDPNLTVRYRDGKGERCHTGYYFPGIIKVADQRIFIRPAVDLLLPGNVSYTGSIKRGQVFK